MIFLIHLIISLFSFCLPMIQGFVWNQNLNPIWSLVLAIYQKRIDCDWRKQYFFNKLIHCKCFYFLQRKEYVKYFSILNDGAKAVTWKHHIALKYNSSEINTVKRLAAKRSQYTAARRCEVTYYTCLPKQQLGAFILPCCWLGLWQGSTNESIKKWKYSFKFILLSSPWAALISNE